MSKKIINETPEQKKARFAGYCRKARAKKLANMTLEEKEYEWKRVKEYKTKNADRMAANQRRWVAKVKADPEKAEAYRITQNAAAAAYKERNPEKHKSDAKQHYEENKEKIRVKFKEYRREWYEKNGKTPERIAAHKEAVKRHLAKKKASGIKVIRKKYNRKKK